MRFQGLKIRFLAVAPLLLLIHPCAYALNPSLDISQYAHTAWKIRDGFTKGMINSIAQTPDGYLWLGTEFGLLRFDGVRAVPWQPAAGEQLPSNYIVALLVTRDGTLWISTWMGLASWKDDKLRQYPEVAGQHVYQLMQDREGTVWFGAAQPGRVCAIRGNKAECYGSGSFGIGVTALYQDRRGNLWLSASTGLWRWAPGPPERYPYPRVAEVNSMIEGDSGTLLLASSDGLQQLVDGKIRSYVLPGVTGQFRPDAFLRTSDGSLWVGTYQGLLRLHQGRMDRFGATDGLSGNVVDRIFEDREGDIWVNTLDGLDRFREFAVPTISLRQGLASSGAYSVQATPDGSIWIGTSDGLNRWQNGQITVYGTGKAHRVRVGDPMSESSASKLAATEIADSGLEGQVTSLGQDDRGRLWVATTEAVFFLENGRFTCVRGVAGGNIFSIAADGHGGAWILNGGADLLHLDSDGDVQHLPWPHAKDRYWGVLLPDRLNGGLWLGFTDGGMAYLKDGRVLAAHDQADGLGHGYVSDLRLGSDGAVWVATESGLSRLKDGRITTLTSKNGLPCNALDWVMEDDYSFWLYMQCGLVRIARSELALWIHDSRRVVETTVFDSSDGVRSSGRFGGYGPHVTKSPDGRIWFVPGDGVSVVDPRHLAFNKLPPSVHIQQIMADRKSYDATTARHLPALTHDLEIDYTALSYVAPEKNRFKYKLEGYDRDWIDAGNRRQAFYTKLPPRGYTFRVKASNNSSVWNEAGASLNFSVDPAYYQTVWFRALCAAAFLTLLWALYRYRVRQIAREFNVRMEERVGERTRIARDLHDTLLQSFQALMLHLQLVDELLPERGEKAKEQLEQTLERADQAIAEGRSAVYDLRSSTVTTNDLALAVKALGKELATQDAPTFDLVVEGQPRDLHPIIRDELYRITREALRNAFTHAQAQHVEVEIAYTERLIRVRIRDDGTGIKQEILEHGRSGHYGLGGMRERASQIGAKLIVWSGTGAGTEIELSIDASIACGSSSNRSRRRLFQKKMEET